MTPRFTPKPHEHPAVLLELLDRLSPDLPPSPWDATVERLLNGLRDPHLYLGRLLADGTPYLFQRKLATMHALFNGGTGSGKSALGVAPMAFQLIAHRDSSVVVIDMKGDHALFWGTFAEAKLNGLPFKWFTTQPGAASFVFNPFGQWFDRYRDVNARSQSYLTSMGLYFGETYGKGFFGAVSLDTITRFLAHYRDIRSFEDLSRYAEEPGSYAATHTDPENSQQLRMLLRQLAAVRPLNVSERSKPAVAPAVLDHEIDFSDVVTRKQVVYFSLPSLESELTAKSVGKLALYAVVQAASILRRLGPTVPVYVFVDEFQQLVNENVKILLEMARSMGVHLILSHQDVSQLKTGEFDISNTVESCTMLKMSFESSAPLALDQMVKAGGKTRAHTLSWNQALPPGFDENDTSLLTPHLAYPKHPFEPATLTVGEQLLERLSHNQVLAHSAHPLRAFVRSRADGGLTQYSGQVTEIECEFPVPLDLYQARSNTLFPSEHPSCVTVPDRPDDEDGDAGPALPNKPLPVPKPPRSTDRAIADRLKALHDAIRQPPASSPSGR